MFRNNKFATHSLSLSLSLSFSRVCSSLTFSLSFSDFQKNRLFTSTNSHVVRGMPVGDDLVAMVDSYERLDEQWKETRTRSKDRGFKRKDVHELEQLQQNCAIQESNYQMLPFV
jgi:hypothetical protein